MVQASSSPSDAAGRASSKSGVFCMDIRIAQPVPIRYATKLVALCTLLIRQTAIFFHSSNSKLVCKSSTCARTSHIANPAENRDVAWRTESPTSAARL